jgi:hypothetical protein
MRSKKQQKSTGKDRKTTLARLLSDARFQAKRGRKEKKSPGGKGLGILNDT